MTSARPRVLKALGFKYLKAHPFRAVGFKYASCTPLRLGLLFIFFVFLSLLFMVRHAIATPHHESHGRYATPSRSFPALIFACRRLDSEVAAAAAVRSESMDVCVERYLSLMGSLRWALVIPTRYLGLSSQFLSPVESFFGDGVCLQRCACVCVPCESRLVRHAHAPRVVRQSRRYGNKHHTHTPTYLGIITLKRRHIWHTLITHHASPRVASPHVYKT